MGTKRKALILGDITEYKYHPLPVVAEELTCIFAGAFDTELTEERERLETDRLIGVDLLVSYADRFRVPVTPGQSAGLLAYVSRGGGLLVLHNGISLQANYELSHLIGAKFTGHPPFGPLDFYPVASGHPAMLGTEPFSMEEEPYRFELDPFGERTILLEYEHERKRYPAAWAHSYGLGRVVYLMPGHRVESFRHPAYRGLILNSALWICKG